MTIAAFENVISNAERRAAVLGLKQAQVRVIDLHAAIPAMSGKLELVYEGEQEGLHKVATRLVGQAVRAVFEKHFPPGLVAPKKDRPRRGEKPEDKPARNDGPYKAVIDHFALGRRLEITDLMPEAEYVRALAAVPGLEAIAREHGRAFKPEELGVAMEFVLEGLHQSSLLAKEDIDRGILYCDLLGAMYDG
jgi:magnesium chelatase subunit I